MPIPDPAISFARLRELALKIPEGARELLPIIDFLETFPEQVTEVALIHLVGVTALGMAKASQGGIWDGSKWLFLRGNACPFPTNPGAGWMSLPWIYGDEQYGHLVIRTSSAPAALSLLLAISAPLLAWRRLEALRSDQNRALAIQLSRLNTLFDLTRHLGELESRQELIRVMGNTVAGEFLIHHLLVLGSHGEVLLARGLGQLPAIVSGEVLRDLLAEKGLVHALELRDQDHSHGFTYLAEPSNGPLSDEDELFLQTLLNITSSQLSAVELRESRIQTLKLEKDLELARNIQRQILPKRLPEPEGWQCAAANLPYQAVGGDLYDLWMACCAEGQDRLHLALADISGKGLPASLMMTQLSAYLRALADGPVDDWGKLAERLNARMNEVRDRNRYATLFLGSLNPFNGELRYVNGGHNPPLLIRGPSYQGGPPGRTELGQSSISASDDASNQDEVIHLFPTGPLVGLLPEVRFTENRTVMNPGDVLLAYTDGVVEAENIQGQELGEEPLIQVVRENRGASADDLFEKLLACVFQHLEGRSFKDDVTLMVVKRMEG